MSKDAVIKVVDTDKTLTSLDKLRVRKTGGGYNYWVPEAEVQLTTKHISKNGTYKAKEDGKYGYSEVTVNVSGGKGSAKDDGKPAALDGGTILPGGVGSAVVGEDEDGNEAVVGVDEDGKLVKTPIPSAIEIITPPAKTEYTSGETMDYSGIVVGLKKKDGSTFTDATYPNGHIPMGELVFPVDKAHSGGGDSASSDLETGAQMPIPFATVAHAISQPGGINIDYHVVNDGVVTLWTDGQFCAKVFASSKSGQRTYASHSDIVIGLSKTYTYQGKTVYYYDESIFWEVGVKSVTPMIQSDGNYDPAAVAWTMVYGTPVSNSDIPVQWASPYDGRELETSFEITVTSAPEGSGGGGTS